LQHLEREWQRSVSHPQSDRCRMKRGYVFHPQRLRRTQIRGRRAQAEQHSSTEGVLVGKLKRASSRPYPGNGSSSRIQCGAVTGPVLRMRISVKEPALVAGSPVHWAATPAALLLELLQTLAAQCKANANGRSAEWSWGFGRPAATFSGEPEPNALRSSTNQRVWLWQFTVL
jgi:hypothetical protein